METDLFSQRRIELMLEMALKKYDNELSSLKQIVMSLNSELALVKRQLSQQSTQQIVSPRQIEIVDIRPSDERHQEFVSGASKNSEPARPRYGDYKSEDVSIEKFFYFGNKR